MSDTTSRRKARKVGMQLTKLRENSPWYQGYGPYMLTLNGQIEYHSMDSETVAEVLDELVLEAKVREKARTLAERADEVLALVRRAVGQVPDEILYQVVNDVMANLEKAADVLGIELVDETDERLANLLAQASALDTDSWDDVPVTVLKVAR